MKPFATLISAAALAFVSLSVQAQAVKPDLNKGAALYGQVCVACHAADGNSSTPANPKLAQQHPEYLVKQLQEFKSGKRAIVPSALRMVFRKPSAAAIREGKSSASHCRTKAAASCPVFAFQPSSAGSIAIRISSGNRSGSSGCCAHAASASAGIPSIWRTRASIGDCHPAGPSHMSAASAARISHL